MYITAKTPQRQQLHVLPLSLSVLLPKAKFYTKSTIDSNYVIVYIRYDLK